MELLYSMRRAPLAFDPPYLESLNGGPTQCVLSNGNIAAFSSLTRLGERSGDSWGSHVYVCDINTPWDSRLVASYVHQVSALEWDTGGDHLLVATSAGDVYIYGSRDYLLNEWVCLYTASLPGEHIIKAAFFHNGRRLLMNVDKKSEQLPCTERLQYSRMAPTVRGFGGVACDGGAVITASGMVAAFLLPTEAGGGETQLQLVSDSLLTNRSYVVTADICYSNDGKLLVAVCGGSGDAEPCVRCFRVCVRRSSGAPQVTVHVLPGFYQREGAGVSSTGMTVRLVRWWLREDTDTLLVAADCGGGAGRGSVVDAWTLTDRALPVHAPTSKLPTGTTPGGKPDCFNTVEWMHAQRFRAGDARVVSLTCARGQVCAAGSAAGPTAPYVAVGCADNTLHLLHRNLTRVCSVAVCPVGGGASEAAAAGATPPKVPRRGALPSGVESAVVSCCDTSRLGGVLLCVDTHSQLHLYRLPQPATDITTPLSIQQATTLLEYAIVAGYDYLDILLTLKPTAIEAVYERISESFQRQPAPFQQYHYVSWLCLRAALCRLLPEGQARASDLTCLLMLHSTANAFKALLRPAELQHDKGPAESLAQLVREDNTAPSDIHKVLMVLEAKDFAAEPLALQSLRRLVQRVADTALAMLAALPARHAHKPRAHTPHTYELCSDPTALNLMRELLVISRVWGLLRAQALPTFARAPDGSDVLAALYRLVSKLVHQPAPMESALEECLTLPSQVLIPRVWESPPRCCVAAPHGQHYPLYLEYGIEPEKLRFNAEAPATVEGSTADNDMDSIRYIHLGPRAARLRRCTRCGARAHSAAHIARTHAQRAWDMRWLPTCRCGGRWSLQVNT